MQKKLLLLFSLSILLYSCFTSKKTGRYEEDKDEYDNPMARGQLESEKIKDPALGYVPFERYRTALNRTQQLRNISLSARNYLPLVWEERGPIYDSVGPSNGNGRGGSGGNRNLGGYTSGRIRAFLLDTLNDPTGNTALTGGVAGGVWRCTNFLSAEPNWTPIDENFTNLAIGYIGQDPSNPQVIYVATGEATSNADAVYGNGVYKSTDGGLTFQWLPSTANFLRNYKIGCDAAGNVYLATRTTTTPVSQTQGMFRSTDGGATWVNITPTGLTTNNNTCTDFEITASGTLNATFGYLAGNTLVNQRYTTNPATVTQSTWSTGTGFRVTSGAIRTEMAVAGEVLYAITVNTSYNTDSCYKSVDGGATWTKQNTTVLPSGLGSQQGWYNLAMAINPENTSQLIAGGLDAYRSTNNGVTWTKFTNWVSTMPYVHADHHNHMYWIKNGETRIIMASDGGIFYSTDNGNTFVDKNRNLGIKQFYAGAIHPAAGSPYLLAGAQDNGTHQLNNAGLSYSIEVTGGDGCFVHINQLNPNIQFGSYVYNQYRRSTNGGASWSSVNLSSSQGLFVNPFDHDDANNIMYASQGPLSQMRRWVNTHNSTTNATVGFSTATLGSATVSLTAFKVSPYTNNRLFFGTNNGRVFRVEGANAITTATADAATTNIGSASFPAGYVSCVTTGTTDDNLAVVFSNYGVNNVWVSTNGGSTWSAIDGDLPDMPVRWALFEPGDNNKLYIATEAGVYTTKNISGASTNWLPEPGFPIVRTDMIKMRNSDSTIVAATHGRGLFTAKIPPCGVNQIDAQPQNTAVCLGDNATFSVTVGGPQALYQWQVSTDGGNTYTNIPGATAATYTVNNVTAAMNGYRYRNITDTYCSGELTSNGGILTVNTPAAITSCISNVTVNNTPNQCGATVNYPALNATGNPAPAITYSHPSGTFFPVGTTTVTATATNACATVSCTFTVTVNDNQAPAAACPANVTVSTPAGACTASVTSANPVTSDNCAVTLQTWAITGATTGSSAATGINSIGTRAFNIGVSTVTYTVRDAAGNTTTCSYTVTVNDGQLPVINTQPANRTVCAGTNTTFSVVAVTAPNAGGSLSYQWQLWDGSAWNNISGATAATLTLNNVTHAMNDNSYRVIVTGLCTPVTSGVATLRVNPIPTISITASPSPVLTPMQNTTLTAVTNQPGGSYVWLLGGQPTGATGATLSGLTVDNTGSYTVRYTDANGCVNTSAAVEVTAQQTDLMWVYPNPNQGQFQVRIYSTANTPFTLNVFDAKGAKVFTKTVSPTQAYTTIPVDLGNTKPMGVYVVELRGNTGKRLGSKQISVNK